MIDRIVIVGLGSIGRRHLKIARDLFPSADIRILRHTASTDSAVESNGNLFSIEEAVLFKPQVAVVANPSPNHLEIAHKMIDVGAHILIEKPISISVKGVRDLIHSATLAKLVVMTGYNLRYMKSLSKFRQLLQEGTVGEVLSVRSEVGLDLRKWRQDVDYRESVSARHALGGGVLLELSHELDYLRWIFGEVNWVRATLMRQSNLEIDVEDTGHITLGFDAKASNKTLVANLNIDMIRQDPVRTCVAIGIDGSLRWNGLTGVVEKFASNSQEWKILFKHDPNLDNTYESEWVDFINSAKSGVLPLVTGMDGLKVLEIVEAIRCSAPKGTQTLVSGGIEPSGDPRE